MQTYDHTQSEINAIECFTHTHTHSSSVGLYHSNGVSTMGCSKCFSLGVCWYERNSIQVK